MITLAVSVDRRDGSKMESARSREEQAVEDSCFMSYCSKKKRNDAHHVGSLGLSAIKFANPR